MFELHDLYQNVLKIYHQTSLRKSSDESLAKTLKRKFLVRELRFSWTAFFNTETDDSGKHSGKLVEFSRTEQLFGSPVIKETEDYINGNMLGLQNLVTLWFKSQ